MVTPTREEIAAKALELYFADMVRAGHTAIPTPQIPTKEEEARGVTNELREGNYWESARLELMRSEEAQALDREMEHLERSASQLKEVVVKSETLKDLIEASRDLELAEERLRDLKRKRRKEREEAEKTIESLKEQMERIRKEYEKKLEEEKPTAFRIRFKTDYVVGIEHYRAGDVIETSDIAWALGLIDNKIAERVAPEVPLKRVPPPKELTKEELERLESEFRLILDKRLGRVPRRAMDEFRVEAPTFKTLPYEEALNSVKLLAEEIIKEEARPPRVRIPKPPVERPPAVIEVPEEILIAPVELPKKPICKELPFPRAPCSPEKDILWRHFQYEMARMGKDFTRYMRAYKERINLSFRSWEILIRTYKDFIQDIEEGKPLRLIPLVHIPMPWSQVTEEAWRYDAIIHFVATKIYKTIDELINALETYGVRPAPTPEEVKEAAIKAWKEKNIWFTSIYEEDLAALGIEV